MNILLNKDPKKNPNDGKLALDLNYICPRIIAMAFTGEAHSKDSCVPSASEVSKQSRARSPPSSKSDT